MEARTGFISIDNIRIDQIPLTVLRSRLSIIPQDPVLFTGTIRSNLDPFKQYTDKELWNILDATELTTIVKSLNNGLDAVIAEGGENFSLGQRQLLCLGRAALKKAKIVVMDEATASLDFHTDILMKKFVATQFKNSTVLTIAHRLNTILHADRIMVFEGGKLVEFASPAVLLNDSKGFLSKLVRDTNSATNHIREEGNIIIQSESSRKTPAKDADNSIHLTDSA